MNAKRIVCRALATIVCLLSSLSMANADEWHFSNVQRIVAISDVHGAYADMVLTLQNASVIDDQLAWSGGKTHLVLTGDMVDRGAESRSVMDLMRRLESEAIRAGGQVHVLLGNHEVMNMIGDLRYVSDAEFAAFYEEESDAERQFWYQNYVKEAEPGTDPEVLLAEFNEKAPLGYFGHRRAFRSDGEYGKWLLQKPLMIVINDTAFVHGGIPPYVADHGLDGVNRVLKADVQDYLATRSILESAGILSPVDTFRGYSSVLMEKMSAAGMDEVNVAAAQKMIRLKDSPIHRPHGPLWYRGSSACSVLAEGDGLDAALRRIGAERAVIGHTTTVSRQIQQRLDGRVIEINTGMLKPSYHGSGYALVIEGGEISVASQTGVLGLLPIKPPRRVGYESDLIDDKMLETVLSKGEIVASGTKDQAWRLVSVAAGQDTIFAQFNAAENKTGFLPELAAYRLDRLLGLDMIPATVSRDIDGIPGTLQFVPTEAISERERFVDDQGDDAPCPLEKQRRAMRVFDTLIQNPARTPLSILYNPETGNLLLVDHANSFTIDGEYSPSPEIDDQWRKALRGLSDRKLRDKLSDVLDDDRLKALANRRDVLISDYGTVYRN